MTSLRPHAPTDRRIAPSRRAVALLFLASALAPLCATALGAQSVLPRYERRLLLETTSETSANISFGDLNGDGHLDIVLAKGRHWPLVDRVLLGDGRGGIREAYDLGSVSDKTYSGHLVDMDGDGDLDVVISNDTPDTNRVYLNDGRGRFTPGSTFGVATWPTRNATVADINGDRRPDIIVANRYGRAPGSNYICLNKVGARFDSTCVAFSAEPSTTITVADFTSDGIPDLLVPHRNGGQSHLYVNSPHVSFSALTRIPFGAPDAQVRVAAAVDLDGDGKNDVVTIDERRGVTAVFGIGDGRFRHPITLGDSSVVPYALTTGDLNRDGHPDVVVGFVQSAPIAYINDGTGRQFTAVSFGDAQGAVYGIAIADFDADGVPDIGVARSEAPNVVYFGALSTSPRTAVVTSDTGRRVINPPGITPLVPAYSVAVRDGEWVFVSGMTGVIPGSQDIIAGGVGAQTRQTMENIRAAVTLAGASMADVAECTVYLKDMADYAAMNTEYMTFFPHDPPARATLAVTAMPRPAALVEIKCSARIRRR